MKEFFAMGGYAVYVWTSVGLFFLAIIIDIASLNKREKTVKRTIRSFLRRKRNTPK